MVVLWLLLLIAVCGGLNDDAKGFPFLEVKEEVGRGLTLMSSSLKGFRLEASSGVEPSRGR